MILPSVQVPIAAALLYSAHTRTYSGLLSTVGPPERLVCLSINAPVTLLTVFRWLLPRPIDFADDPWTYSSVFLIGTGLLWYLVGIEVERGLGSAKGLLPTSQGYRFAVDILLVAIGLLLAAFAFVARDLISRIHVSPGYAVVVALLLGAWAIALVATYGLDAFRTLRSRQTA